MLGESLNVQTFCLLSVIFLKWDGSIVELFLPFLHNHSQVRSLFDAWRQSCSMAGNQTNFPGAFLFFLVLLVLLVIFHTRHALQAICAKSGEEPCCDWVGEDGSGHFVKVSFHQHVLPPMDTLMLILLGYNTFNFISLIP